MYDERRNTNNRSNEEYIGKAYSEITRRTEEVFWDKARREYRIGNKRYSENGKQISNSMNGVRELLSTDNNGQMIITDTRYQRNGYQQDNYRQDNYRQDSYRQDNYRQDNYIDYNGYDRGGNFRRKNSQRQDPYGNRQYRQDPYGRRYDDRNDDLNMNTGKSAKRRKRSAYSIEEQSQMHSDEIGAMNSFLTGSIATKVIYPIITILFLIMAFKIPSIGKLLVAFGIFAGIIFLIINKRRGNTLGDLVGGIKATSPRDIPNLIWGGLQAPGNLAVKGFTKGDRYLSDAQDRVIDQNDRVNQRIYEDAIERGVNIDPNEFQNKGKSHIIRKDIVSGFNSVTDKIFGATEKMTDINPDIEEDIFEGDKVEKSGIDVHDETQLIVADKDEIVELAWAQREREMEQINPNEYHTVNTERGEAVKIDGEFADIVFDNNGVIKITEAFSQVYRADIGTRTILTFKSKDGMIKEASFPKGIQVKIKGNGEVWAEPGKKILADRDMQDTIPDHMKSASHTSDNQHPNRLKGTDKDENKLFADAFAEELNLDWLGGTKLSQVEEQYIDAEGNNKDKIYKETFGESMEKKGRQATINETQVNKNNK